MDTIYYHEKTKMDDGINCVIGRKAYELEKFENFFREFDELYVPIKEKPIKLPTTEKFEVFFNQFEEIYAPFFKSGGTINVWSEAQLKRDEVRNCSVLKWLLDCKGSHGQGGIFFEALLSFLSVPLDPVDLATGYATRAELVYDTYDYDNENNEDTNSSKQKRNRVDIVLQNEHFLMFIEVKIDAPEGKNQLKRYSDILEKQCSNSKKGFLAFLTPRHNYIPEDSKSLKSGVPRNDSGLDNYIPEASKSLKYQPTPLSWKQLAHAFETALPKDSITQNTIQKPLWVALVQQFCEHVRQF